MTVPKAGSTCLTNPRRELFCQIMAGGKTTKISAYEKAGFARDKDNCMRLAKAPEVIVRIKYLRDVAVDKATDAIADTIIKEELTKQWVLDRLMLNAKIAMGEATRRKRVQTKTTRGKIGYVEMDVLEPSASAANAALKLLGMEVGMFAQENKPPPRNDLLAPKDASDSRVAEALERYKAAPTLRSIAGGKEPA